MANKFKQMTNSEAWELLASAATRGLEEQGYELKRLPGRGRSNVYTAEIDGKSFRTSIRTTKNRSFAYPSAENGAKWKTLDDADLVVVAAVNSRANPQDVEVYLFDAAEVREQFNAAYSARTDAGLTVRENFGMWLRLDKDDRDIPRSVGTGLGDSHPPIAIYSIDELTSDDNHGSMSMSKHPNSMSSELSTIAEVVDWARQRISLLAGVDTDAVKLDLKIQY